MGRPLPKPPPDGLVGGPQLRAGRRALGVSLEQAQTLRRSPGQCLTGRTLPLLQAQVAQDLLDDLRVLDGRDGRDDP